MENYSVVVSREWHTPNIDLWVNGEHIGIRMMLPDFVKALAAEIGTPTASLTQAQLERKLLAAAERITTHMKMETTRT